MQWSSSTSPPIISPLDFVAYGYGSCTAWSTLLTYVARAVGIPARQVGTPCWNSGPFAGLATANANVSQCWHGGDATTSGGLFLYNHNWVEYWSDTKQDWVFINVPTQNSIPDQGLCSFSSSTGCDYNNEVLTPLPRRDNPNITGAFTPINFVLKCPDGLLEN